MGETYLYQPELSARLRVLKERRRSYPGGVPVAGRNPTRRKYWMPHPVLPGLGDSRENGKFIDVANLLLCWDFETEGDLESFQLRVVHTTEPGHYGDAVRCNFEIGIEPGGGIFEYRSFAGSDDPVDFFNIHIDKDENEA
ncbi:hypothetical protein [Nesterenkonia ebinurensis]|uniref:hypothetical protein n=1 Tax=Nesterenkonia ebinurensis TaxID=2608252 RepID=UPI00168A579B|nr:hypothetical protein [Nesterenkonia ebinurensis]